MNGSKALWIYGSYARGDNDRNSDLDLLAVSDQPFFVEISDLFPGAHLSLSSYSWREIERMVDYGSVFLHHVAREGRPLRFMPEADGCLRALLKRLGPYRRTREDLRAFRETVSDVRSALAGDCSPNFEMAVLASVLRHASVLACFIGKDPAYQRDVVFARLESILCLPLNPAHLQAIYSFRLSEERGAPLERCATTSDVSRAADTIEQILERMEGLADDYEATMPA
ncbi:MAG TPA: nucleotidyltransferase domain-containing protein [Acidimicrobiia bacterium]|nr:nucleotidyltransferase domain-containing protein [Acidimicrobiia bacterium]